MERSPEDILNIIERIRVDLTTKKKASIYHNNLFVIGEGGNVLFKDSFITKMGLNKYIKAIVFRSLKERTNYIANLTPSRTVWSLLKTNYSSELDSSSVPKDMVAMNFQFNKEGFKDDNKMNESTSLIKTLLRESLEEAERSVHLKSDSYPSRILRSTFKDMGAEHKVEVDKRLANIESLEFGSKKPQKIGIWVYKTKEFVKHEPFTPRDKGNLLLLIVNDNNMSTLYWKHQLEGQYDYEIKYEDLMEFAQSEYYDAQKRPVSIANIKAWKNSKNAPEQKDKFQKLPLPNGVKVRYYRASARFETIKGQPIKLDNIFDSLPDNIQDEVLNNLDEGINETIIETVDEAYPSSFDKEHFATLNSFAARVRYCQQHLSRISSGSSRIAYKIDNEKVLKLAKNEKGLAQNETEIEYSNYHDIEDIVARVFDHHPKNLWVEMELARKVTKGNFKQITGLNFDEYGQMLKLHSHAATGRGQNYFSVSDEVQEQMWENPFSYSFLDFVGNYSIESGAVGDLARTSSYGMVKRNGQDEIVLIDYGLTSATYDTYYS